MAELTPMKAQYNEIKSPYPRLPAALPLGDFYELFDEDAKKAARELDWRSPPATAASPPMSRRPCARALPLGGGVYRPADRQGLQGGRLRADGGPRAGQGAGEAGRDPRENPRHGDESSMLEEGRSNYVCAVYLDAVSARRRSATCPRAILRRRLRRGLRGAHRQRAGALFPARGRAQRGRGGGRGRLLLPAQRLGCLLEPDGGRFDYMAGAAALCEQFGAQDVDALGLGDAPAAVRACGALLRYVKETQKCDLSNIDALDLFEGGTYMELDYAARRSLELTENQRTGEKRGSLLWVLDRTKTPMGGRLLRSWVERPLLSPVAIKRRLSAVSELHGESVLRQELRRALAGIGDMQRLVGRAVFGSANGRDLAALGECCAQLPELKRLLAWRSSALLRQAAALDELADVRQGHRARHLRRAPLLRARGRHPPQRLLGGGGPPAQHPRQRREARLRAGSARARSYGHQKAQGRLQQGIRLLYRRAELRRGRGAAAGVHTQADAGLQRALFHARAEGAGDGAHRRARAHLRAGVQLLHRAARERGRARGAHQAQRGGRGGAGRALLPGRGGRAQQLHLPGGGPLRRHRHQRGAAPGGGARAEGHALRPERHAARRGGRPRGRHHRPQHGRQEHLYAPDGAHRADGADGLLRAGKVGLHRRGGPRVHAHRRLRRPLRRAEHLHGGDDGGGGDPPLRDEEQPHHPRRDRPRHLHLRRHGHRPRRARILRRAAAGGPRPCSPPTTTSSPPWRAA